MEQFAGAEVAVHDRPRNPAKSGSSASAPPILNHVRSAIVVASIAVLAACGARADARRVDSQGVSLLIPSSWRILDAHSELTSGEMEGLLAENPEWERQLRLLANPRTPIALLAFSGSAERGSVSVYTYRAARTETTHGLERRTLTALRLLPGFRLFERRTRRIAGVPSVLLRYVVTYRIGNQRVRFRTLQILVVHKRREYSVTYSGDPETFASRRSVFRRSAATLHIS